LAYSNLLYKSVGAEIVVRERKILIKNPANFFKNLMLICIKKITVMIHFFFIDYFTLFAFKLEFLIIFVYTLLIEGKILIFHAILPKI